MADLFGLYLQRGLVDVALLGGAQIDRYGNLNTTVIGDYAHPKTRLPGSGGACEIAINAQNVFMIMRLKRRAFVEKLDFITSPGHQTGRIKPAATAPSLAAALPSSLRTRACLTLVGRSARCASSHCTPA